MNQPPDASPRLAWLNVLTPSKEATAVTGDEIKQTAAYMLDELRSQKLTVIALPDGRDNSHRGIRAVVCPNPEWYSRLCQQHLKQRPKRYRRARTTIKRVHTLRALEAISIGNLDRKFLYHERVLEAVEYVHEALSLSEKHGGFEC